MITIRIPSSNHGRQSMVIPGKGILEYRLLDGNELIVLKTDVFELARIPSISFDYIGDSYTTDNGDYTFILE